MQPRQAHAPPKYECKQAIALIDKALIAIKNRANLAAHGRVLVAGAGGGREREDMARAHPRWRFDGLDPSQPILRLAAQRLERLASHTA